jgi:hypothetical protein
MNILLLILLLVLIGVIVSLVIIWNLRTNKKSRGVVKPEKPIPEKPIPEKPKPEKPIPEKPKKPTESEWNELIKQLIRATIPGMSVLDGINNVCNRNRIEIQDCIVENAFKNDRQYWKDHLFDGENKWSLLQKYYQDCCTKLRPVGDCTTSADCGHGYCEVLSYEDPSKCRCDRMWAGRNCDKVACSLPQDCNFHGHCINGLCQCQSGYKGDRCEIVD